MTAGDCSRLTRILLSAAVVLASPGALALENGLARTPPMGWASWNTYAGNVQDSLFRAQADAMVTSGLRDAGYQYIIIDEPGLKRQADGSLLADASKFPEGMKSLVDYIHAKGLKAGIYTTRGRITCMNVGYAGAQGFEQRDAQQFADWGFDYVKDDDCDGNAPSPEPARAQYEKMRDALAATGRPMVFSLVTWWTPSAAFGNATGNLWRIGGDIRACWDCTQGVQGGTNGVVNSIDRARSLAGAARPGGWNDPDMLEVGVKVAGYQGLSASENRAHFAMWAMLAAPLLAGNDLTAMPTEVHDILTDSELIAIDQDAWGFQAVKLETPGAVEVWSRPLAGIGSRAVALFNRSSTDGVASFRWTDIGLDGGSASVHELGSKQDLGELPDGMSRTVPAHSAVVFRIEGRVPSFGVGKLSLSALTPAYVANYWGPAERDRSNGEALPGDGNPLRLRGHEFDRGLGVSAPSRIAYEVGGRCSALSAVAGIDDETSGKGSVIFQVWGDGKRLFQTPPVSGTDAAALVDADISGVQLLELQVQSAGDTFDFDHADWADAAITCSPLAAEGGSSSSSGAGGVPTDPPKGGEPSTNGGDGVGGNPASAGSGGTPAGTLTSPTPAAANPSRNAGCSCRVATRRGGDASLTGFSMVALALFTRHRRNFIRARRGRVFRAKKST